ncbi:MAG TPA: transglutaminase-like domain-containing protein [Pirellulales bacterium]|nr:transglutaminase-like domain-containing protein [Pirellulales bacterium]
MERRFAPRQSLFWAANPVILVSILLIAIGGCQKTTVEAPRAAAEPGASESAGGEEIWEALFLENAKIGYSRTLIRPVVRGDQKLVQIETQNHMTLLRFGQSVEQDLNLSTLETPDGRVRQFTTEASFGTNPVRFIGRVDSQQMVIETRGRPGSSRIPWSDAFRGFRGVEQSLADKPLAPGERRTLQVLAPLVNQVARVELTGRDVETTAVLGTPQKLLRIDTVAHLPDGNVMEETLWTDKRGETIKRRVEAMQQESHRTSRQLATAAARGKVSFDLGTNTLVKLDKPLADPHHASTIRYRVELTSADPTKVFASGSTQSLRALGPHAAELTVRRLLPGHGPPKNSTQVPAEYRVANSLLEIGDPRIREMAEQARGGLRDPREVAVRLEHYVHDIVATKDFSQTFATAAETAQSRQGDCTEHAVLLAALARACGIPSRVAIGLVYVPRSQGFGYHMWTELFLDGEWTPFDATLGLGGIGAGHLKISDSSLAGAGAYSTFLSVAQVVGQLKISVLDVE